MRDVLDRLAEEATKAKGRKETKLHSRLHEARREIEYLRWVLNAVAALDDGYIPGAIRGLAKETSEGNKIGPAHPILNQKHAEEIARRVALHKTKTAKHEFRRDARPYRAASLAMTG